MGIDLFEIYSSILNRIKDIELWTWVRILSVTIPATIIGVHKVYVYFKVWKGSEVRPFQIAGIYRSQWSTFRLPDSLVMGELPTPEEQARIRIDQNYDILRIVISSQRLIAKQIYVHRRSQTHGFECDFEKISNKSGRYWEGEWSREGPVGLRGRVAFFLKVKRGIVTLDGTWIGASHSSQMMRFGTWNLRKVHDNAALFSKYSRIKRTLKFRFKHPCNTRLLGTIVNKHIGHPAVAEYRGSGLLLHIPKYCFNPNHGKLTKDFLKLALAAAQETSRSMRGGESEEFRPLKVLDIGSGCGIIGIAIAKEVSANVTALDIDLSSVNAANSNAKANGVERHYKAILSDSDTDGQRLFEKIDPDERFDLIVANLPFSHKKHAKDIDDKFLRCVCASERLHESLIFGSLFHLNPSGRLIFTYGGSGFKEAVMDCIKSTGMEYAVQPLPELSKDDEFEIYSLKNVHL